MSEWRPDNDKPRALLVVVHGLGSYGDDFKTVGEFLSERGIAVFAPDMRSFGHYDGLKGHVIKYDEFVEDLQNIIMQVKDRYLNTLTFLLGSSLGGLTAIRHVVMYPRVIDGLVLQAPAVAQNLDISKGKLIAGHLLSFLNVKRHIANDLDFDEATRSPEVAKRHQKDPFRWDFVTPRLGIESLKAAKEASEWGPRITTPILYQQGSADRLVDPEKSRIFYETIASADKTWRLYEGLYHELHEEPEREVVLNDLAAWLDKRLPS